MLLKFRRILIKNYVFDALIIICVFLILTLFSFFFDKSIFFAILTAIAVLAGLLYLRKPLYSLFFLIILRMSLDYSANYYYFPLDKYHLISLSQVMGVAVAIAGLIIIISNKKVLKNFPLNKLFLVIFSWSLITLLYSISPQNSFQEIIRIFDLFIISFLAFVSIKEEKDYKKYIIALFISSIIPISVAVYQIIFNIGYEDAVISIPRIFGTFSHPNGFGMYLFLIITAAVIYLVRFARSRYSRMIILLIIWADILMLYLTYTRIAWISLVVFALFLGFFHFKKILIPLIAIPVILVIFSTQFQNKLDETIHPPVDSSIVWRKNLWFDAISATISEKRLFMGYGINTFPIVSENLRGIRFGSNDPHNDFVKFFVEGGLIGLSVYIMFIGMIIFMIVKCIRHSRSEPKLSMQFKIILYCFTAIIVASLSDNIFKNTPFQWIFWSLLSASLALSNIHKPAKDKLRPETQMRSQP